MDLTFEGKRVIVTGAGRGIGKDLALRLSEYKACVFGLSKTKEKLEELVNIDPNIHPVCVDLSDYDATRKAVESILPIDLLVNNAGICFPALFLEATPESFDEIFNINVRAALNVSQVVAKNMIERKSGGSIVNVSSLSGMKAVKDLTLYAASKGALNMLSKSMALELGPHNIRVNSVMPSILKVGMGEVLLFMYSEVAAEGIKQIPLGRLVEVDEVVDCVMYLLSDRSSMVTGVCLPIDGGSLVG